MKTTIAVGGLCLATILVLGACQPSQHHQSPAEAFAVAETGIAFPGGYETSFVNYLSSDRLMEPNQTIRMFANDVAMQGVGEDGALPFGSVLVAEVYKAKLDESGKARVSHMMGRRVRGDLALIAVMERREEFGTDLAEELKNEHWDFATFKPDGSIAEKNLDGCRACHSPLKNSNHIFSLEHIDTDFQHPATAASADAGSSPGSDVGQDNAVALNVEASDELRFSTPQLEVAAGSVVKLSFKNGGAMPHSFALTRGGTDPSQIAANQIVDGIRTGFVPGGGDKEITFESPEAGEYTYACMMPGHAAAGMTGTLTVTKAEASP